MERTPIKLPTVKQIQKMTVLELADIKAKIEVETEKSRVAANRAKTELQKMWDMSYELSGRIKKAVSGEK